MGSDGNRLVVVLDLGKSNQIWFVCWIFWPNLTSFVHWNCDCQLVMSVFHMAVRCAGKLGARDHGVLFDLLC